MGRHLLVLMAAIFASSASASTNELVTQLQTRKKLDVTAVIQAESNLYEAGSRDYQAGSRLQISPTYRINDRIRTGLSLTLLQDMSSVERKTALANAKLSVSHRPISLSEDSTLLLTGAARLPTNLEDHRDKTFNGSLSLEPTLLTAHSINGFTFTTIYGLYLTKNLHTYDRTNEGKANMNYQATNYFGVEKYLTRRISLTIDGDYTYANSYVNTPATLFSLGQSLTYEEKTWSVTIGHSNGGNALMANGTDYNVKAFDGNTSVVYANMRFVY